MSDLLQHKLSNLELPPPAGNWELIAARLEKERIQSDVVLSEKLGQIELPAPLAAWSNISRVLEPETTTREKAPVIPIMRNRWLAAAAVIGGITLAIWVFRLNQSGSSPTPPAAITQTNPATAPKTVTNEGGVDMSGTVASLIGNIPQRVKVSEYSQPRAQQIVTAASYDSPAASTDNADSDFDHVSPGRYVPSENVAELKGVNAPLIRDSRGRVIMDVDLLKKGSDEYIYVTGPNGEQTRVSARLLSVLIYMNNDSGNQGDYLDFLYNRSETWKKKFEDWRNKLLEQSSFVPSGNTFFDILELRELLKDN